MLRIKPVNDDYCQGIDFDVTDIDGLARALACILIQEFTLARQLLVGASSSACNSQLSSDDIEDIIARRLHPKDPDHRDGFIFQLMMWLAAHLDLGSDDLVALPHSQASAKGQDAIIVHRSLKNVVGVTICEDKATINARDTIRDKVWPELREYERGGRRDELRSSVIAALGLGGVPVQEAIAIVRKISWEGNRRYRVRVTIEPNQRSQKLFAGFDDVVDGDQARRRGETTRLPAIRKWFSALAQKVEDQLRAFAVTH